MNMDRLVGSAKLAKGTAKQVIGKVTGDVKLQADGAADMAAGRIQNTIADMKDALRASLKHR